MVQKDYILRMIETIGLMVSRIRQLITGGHAAEADSQLAEAAARTGITLEIGRKLDGESLLNIFMPADSTIDPTNALLYAEVLFLDGLARKEAGESGAAIESFAKSRLLLRAATGYATSVGVSYPETEERLSEIEELMDGGNAST